MPIDEHLADAEALADEIVESHALGDDVAASFSGAEVEFGQHLAFDQRELAAGAFGFPIGKSAEAFKVAISNESAMRTCRCLVHRMR